LARRGAGLYSRFMPDDSAGTIEDTPLAEALSERYLAYALSTIMSRTGG
jgi:topoisomerase-4 subunit A